jgi:hypothetical protein
MLTAIKSPTLRKCFRIGCKELWISNGFSGLLHNSNQRGNLMAAALDSAAGLIALIGATPKAERAEALRAYGDPAVR